jgi:hypothetical protein
VRDIELLKEINQAAILPADLAGKLKRGLILSVSVSTPKYQQLYGTNYYVSFPYQNELKQKVKRLCAKYNIRDSILE